MYINVDELKALLVDPVWKYYTDHRGNTIFVLLDACTKTAKKETAKKSSKKKEK